MKSGSVRPLPWGRIIGANWMQMGTRHVEARVVKVVVGDSSDKTYWARDFVGDDRMAVKIHVHTQDLDETFYVDYADGVAVEHLTVGRGDPVGLRQLYVQYEVAERDGVERIYGFVQT